MPGELAGDSDRDDRATLAAGLESVPACVQSASACVGVGADRSLLPLSPALKRGARWAASVRRAELGLSSAEMARGVELDAMASRLLGNRRTALFRELAVVPRELGEEEEVLDLAYARLLFGRGLLVLTDRRVLFVNDRTVLSGVAVECFRLDSVRDHRLAQIKDSGQLTLWFQATGWYADRRTFHRVKPLERAFAIDAKLTELLDAKVTELVAG